MKGTGRRRAAGRIAALALAVGTAACAASTTLEPDFGKQEGEGELGRWVHSGYYDRTYELRVPESQSGGARRPLLIVLHGAGDTGRGFRGRIAADAATDAAGFVTVYPDGYAGTWAVGCGCTDAELAGVDDIAFLNTLVRQLEAGLSIDTTRVYVAGYSQGAQLAQRFACVSEWPTAGVAAVAGLILRPVAERCDPPAPLRVVVVHGDEDPVMRYDGFGLGANALSVPEMTALWADLGGCVAPPDEESRPDGNGDGTTVSITRYEGCAGGGRVRLDRVNGGGHTWPGPTGPWPKSTGKLSRNLDATREILAFFGAGAP